MNIRPIKRVTAAILVLVVLALLGISGSLTPASAAGVTINNGVPVTNYPQVELSFTPPAAADQMSFLNDGSTWSDWEPKANSKKWTLSPTAGLKTVSIQFRDSANPTVPIPGKYSGTILLDYSIDLSFANPFGFQGIGLSDSGTAANSVVSQGDGKIVVAGTIDRGNGNTDLAVLRFLNDGTLDPGFAVGGKFTFGGPFADTGTAVAIDGSGKIVVTGSYDQDGAGNTDMLVLRLTNEGTLDSGFRSSPATQAGVVVFTGAGAGSANALAIQPDDKIVVAGTYTNTSGNTDVTVLRFNANGTLDTGFGTASSGSILVGGSGNDQGNAVVLQADGKIVVVGTYDHGFIDTSAWIIRLTTAGVLDTDFGALNGAGPARTGDIAYGGSGSDSGSGVVIKGTSIVVVGTYDWTLGDTDIWVLQLQGDGTPDLAFNGTGSKSFGNSLADYGNAIALQGEKLIVVGSYDINSDEDTALWLTRLNSDGSEDTSFNNGSDYTFGDEGISVGRAVALQADGKILVAGRGNNISLPSSMLTMRLHNASYQLTVNSVGSGSAAAFPGTFSNGSASFVKDSVVTISATPVNGAIFNGWTVNPSDASDSCAGTGDCQVTMNRAVTVTATFTQSYALNVSVTGTGTVTSGVSASINCNSVSGAGCSDTLLDGTSVTLTATQPAWYMLPGTLWSGGTCSGSIATPCTFAMDQARTVAVTYLPNYAAKVVNGDYYATLTDAYTAANASGAVATVQAKNILFQESPRLVLNLPVTVTLQGGKGADFTEAAVGYTSVLGPLEVRSGRLNASYLKVRP